MNKNYVEIIKTSFSVGDVTYSERMVRWNSSNNHHCDILNVDGSCLGTPTRAGFGGLIRNNAGFFLSSFSGFLSDLTCILLAELTAIHKGLQLAMDIGFEELVCY
uniref:Polynucleotidyl transferase, Ribonuclease H fold n=1 Tax=Medicago truncatula TaxID=3880 RepID=Q2HS21_MEDTR|nr:Polynucleotidyl transferase, Ribonuclease H fold [Medicago truncatula]